MRSQQMLALTAAIASFALVLAEPPISSYGPPGYQAPGVVSVSAPRINVVSSGSSRPINAGVYRNNDNFNTGEGGEPEPFNYAYEVKDGNSGNDFSSIANSDGKKVQGEYRVLLPDGRRQIVKYIADDSGYNADVQYEGQARYPVPSVNLNQGGSIAVGGGSGSIGGPIRVPSIKSGPTISSIPIVAGPSPSSSRTSSFSGYRY